MPGPLKLRKAWSVVFFSFGKEAILSSCKHHSVVPGHAAKTGGRGRYTRSSKGGTDERFREVPWSE